MAFNYFNIIQKDDTYGKIPISYPIAIPTTDCVDVHGGMKWKNAGSVEEVPRLLLTEYSLNYSRWSSNLNAISTMVDNIDKTGKQDPYLQLYSGEPTKFYYSLPYLVKPGDSIRGNISNEWADLDTAGALGKLLGGKIGNIIGKAGEALVNAGGQFSAGFGTEPIRSFKSTADNKITISFPLYNTLSLEDAKKHYSFVSLIAFQNLKTRTSFVSFLPPKIYIVDGMCSGGVYMAAAYISDLKIDSIGTTRVIKDLGDFGSDDKDVIIPEAYKVTITFTDLLTQSSNIMWSSLGGPKVKVLNAPDISVSSGAGGAGVSIIPGAPGIGIPATAPF